MGMEKRIQPDVVILSKDNHQPSFLQEFLLSSKQKHIPLELLDSIYVTLSNGEKYKINQSAIKKNLVVDEIDKQLFRIGVPENISTIEIMLDTADAESYITDEVSSMLDRIFNE